MPSYALGLDFGTESVRVLVVDTQDGREVGSAVILYAHGVIHTTLPHNGRVLPPDWALQDAQDYLEAMRAAVPQALKAANISPQEVVGIGVDFTSCTMLPTLADGTPLSNLPAWRAEPHAYVKLWKHHASQPQADQINVTAERMGEAWLPRYGGKISSEWFFSKALQIVQEAPEIYHAAERLIEAGDWLVWQLTGVESRSMCQAGYKAMMQDGQFPHRDYFAALNPDFADVVAQKMKTEFANLGESVGGLTAQWAADFGLRAGIPIATAVIDAHVFAPAVRAVEPGVMVLIMGTSTCHIVCAPELYAVDGLCGVVYGGVAPGLYGYESGQAGVGDSFAWLIEQAVPPAIYAAAQTDGLSVYAYLEREAARQKPGEHGLIALDWWNGNRSTLQDATLSGLLIGATLYTRPADLYRALIEATAYGTRQIIEAYERSGMTVHTLVAAGGLADRNALLRQIYADVTGKPFKLAGSSQSGALGAAIYAAVAAEIYPDVRAASDVMGKLRKEVVQPIPAHQVVYDQLFAEYRALYDTFGRGGNDIMRRLKAIRASAMRG